MASLKKVLVTGGSGLVGYGLKQVVANHTHLEFIFLSSKDGDLTSFSQTHSIFSKFKPDYVIHLAAYVGGLFKNMSQKVDMYEKNMQVFYYISQYHQLSHQDSQYHPSPTEEHQLM